MPLRMWREEMEELRQAFAQFGVPDERLLVPPLTAEEEVQARRRAAEVAREEALILRMEERCEDAAAAAAEFEALRGIWPRQGFRWLAPQISTPQISSRSRKFR